MKIYMIAYRLIDDATRGKEEQLHGAIKALTGYWTNPIQSVWLVASGDIAADEISKRLRGVLGLSEDNKSGAVLFVCELSKDYSGWLYRGTWDWLADSWKA